MERSLSFGGQWTLKGWIVRIGNESGNRWFGNITMLIIRESVRHDIVIRRGKSHRDDHICSAVVKQNDVLFHSERLPISQSIEQRVLLFLNRDINDSHVCVIEGVDYTDFLEV